MNGQSVSASKGLRTSGLILLLVGVIIFGVIMVINYIQTSFANSALPATGRVVELDESCDSDGCSYSPVIEFVTKDEQTSRFESNYSEAPPRFRVGESVEILYDPNDPTRGEVASYLNFWTNPIMVIFAAVGAGIGLLGMLLLVISLLRR
jgi:hypothetical protein